MASSQFGLPGGVEFGLPGGVGHTVINKRRRSCFLMELLLQVSYRIPSSMEEILLNIIFRRHSSYNTIYRRHSFRYKLMYIGGTPYTI